jgi:hypothetical protein
VPISFGDWMTRKPDATDLLLRLAPNWTCELPAGLTPNHLGDFLVRNRSALEDKLKPFIATEDERKLRETWDACLAEKDRNQKGVKLEEAVRILFSRMPGFSRIHHRQRNSIEEIDLVIQNESSDPFWLREGPYILVECKNSKRPAGAPAFDTLRAKMGRKHERCKLGICVSMSGFTSPFLRLATQVTSESSDLILPVDRARFERWIEADDRVQFLKDLHAEVTTGAYKLPRQRRRPPVEPE